MKSEPDPMLEWPPIPNKHYNLPKRKKGDKKIKTHHMHKLKVKSETKPPTKRALATFSFLGVIIHPLSELICLICHNCDYSSVLLMLFPRV